MKVFTKINSIKLLIVKLFRFLKCEYSKESTFNKAVKALVSLLFLIISLNIIIFFLSPNDGWVSLNSDSIYTLEIEAEYVSAANKSYMLKFNPFEDSNISVDFLADKYQLYDKFGNIIEQSEERGMLFLKLGDNEGLTISSASNDSEFIEYNLLYRLTYYFGRNVILYL